MSRPRLELHEILVEILGSSNVYFQPPESVKLVYPCIIYHRNAADTQFADNLQYTWTQRYRVIVIDKNPDTAIIRRIFEYPIPLCTYDRHYFADNLNHDVFNIYY